MKERPSARLTMLKWESPLRMASAALVDRSRLLVLIDKDRHDQQAQQHHRDRGGERPVAIGEELGPQGLSDHQGGGAPEQVRNDEFADDRNEAEQRSGNDAGPRQRNGDAPERLPGRRAEIGGSLMERNFDLFQRGV